MTKTQQKETKSETLYIGFDVADVGNRIGICPVRDDEGLFDMMPPFISKKGLDALRAAQPKLAETWVLDDVYKNGMAQGRKDAAQEILKEWCEMPKGLGAWREMLGKMAGEQEAQKQEKEARKE